MRTKKAEEFLSNGLPPKTFSCMMHSLDEVSHKRTPRFPRGFNAMSTPSQPKEARG
jgi:hypothetical protein